MRGWPRDSFFFFSSRRRHTRCSRDWSSDVCSSDLAALRRQVPDVLVLCAGEGPMRPAIEQQIAFHGLRDTVMLLGHRLDVPALLARAQVACLPSHMEALPNAVIEAMAAGLPVVA